MTLDAVEQVANAVLYEGYLLYPYRASALKNQRRWNFGVVYPHEDDSQHCNENPCVMQTECLCKANSAAVIQIKVRFLRLVERWDPRAAPSPIQEAEEAEVALRSCRLSDLMAKPLTLEFSFPEKVEEEGTVVRRGRLVKGSVFAEAIEVRAGFWKVAVRIENQTVYTRKNDELVASEDNLLQSLVSTHTILRLRDGAFISLIDPPRELSQAAAACVNQRTWPVLAGDETKADTVLSSPIILYDYPQIAPESPGDLFDGTEIDEILTLRILTMTDQEKEEMRRTDPRSREVLERAEALPAEALMKLHGVLRSVGPSGGGAS